MHPAVETILSRMKSHPDEFVNSGKWTQAIGDYKKWFTKEELDAVNEGLRELRMGQFQERIFKILTDDTLDQTIEDNSKYGQPPLSRQRIRMHSSSPTQIELEAIKLEIEKMKLEQQRHLDTDLFLGSPNE